MKNQGAGYLLGDLHEKSVKPWTRANTCNRANVQIPMRIPTKTAQTLDLESLESPESLEYREGRLLAYLLGESVETWARASQQIQ